MIPQDLSTENTSITLDEAEKDILENQNEDYESELSDLEEIDVNPNIAKGGKIKLQTILNELNNE